MTGTRKRALTTAWRTPTTRSSAVWMTRGSDRPTWTSFKPILKSPSAITRWSQKIESTAPPAGACPVIAATSGSRDAASARSSAKKSTRKAPIAARSSRSRASTSGAPLV